MAGDNKQLCENLNNCYQSVGGEAVQQSGDVERGRRVLLDQLSLGEIKHLINTLDTSKATSQEDFPTWLSKEGKEDICVPFQDIINCMLVSGKFPDFYKRAQISPLPKVSQPKVNNDFRPISLLFHLGKLCEQVLVNKLKRCIQNSISSNQVAYRPKTGSTDAILKLIDDVTSDLDSVK